MHPATLPLRPATRPPVKPKPEAKLTAIHRFALATVIPNPDLKVQVPALLPETIPRQCCFNNFRCQNNVRWKVDAGFFCSKHVSLWWETHYVDEHQVARVYADGEIETSDLD